MTTTVIGTCGECGGPVEIPQAWFSVVPPVPTCRHCGAQAADYGPTIKMKKSTKSVGWISNSKNEERFSK